jgi:phosphohistidine phosphatase SixA
VTVALIHWNLAEGRERSRLLRNAGVKVKLEADSRSGPEILNRLCAAPPHAVVVSPALRSRKRTRSILLVFVGGQAEKVERVGQMLPDAVFATWATLVEDIKRAVAHPPANPTKPTSVLAGYSGTPLPKKLGIKSNSSIALLQEPEGFVEILGPLPPEVKFTDRIRLSTNVAIWFVRSGAGRSGRHHWRVTSTRMGSGRPPSRRAWSITSLWPSTPTGRDCFSLRERSQPLTLDPGSPTPAPEVPYC